MALKFAYSFGAHAVQITTSLRKKEDALRLAPTKSSSPPTRRR